MRTVQSCVLLIVSVLFSISLKAQNQNYTEMTASAIALYKSEKYEEAAKLFEEAFLLRGDDSPVADRYNAACSWALANRTDEAFRQLETIVDSGDYQILSWLVDDADFQSLRNDNRWKILISKLEENKEKGEALLNKELVAILAQVYEEDQKYRQQLGEIEKKYGFDSDELSNQWKIINEKDSINLGIVTEILDEYGWLGAETIGKEGNMTIFLVIQHSDLKTQEKYLPMLREAVKNKKAPADNLALLEDRVAMRNGKPQIYGSQVMRDSQTGNHILFPVIDPDNLDLRRDSVGLSPIKNYLQIMGLEWDLEEYKAKLPELEAKYLKNK